MIALLDRLRPVIIRFVVAGGELLRSPIFQFQIYIMTAVSTSTSIHSLIYLTLSSNPTRLRCKHVLINLRSSHARYMHTHAHMHTCPHAHMPAHNCMHNIHCTVQMHIKRATITCSFLHTSPTYSVLGTARKNLQRFMIYQLLSTVISPMELLSVRTLFNT